MEELSKAKSSQSSRQLGDHIALAEVILEGTRRLHDLLTLRNLVHSFGFEIGPVKSRFSMILSVSIHLLLRCLGSACPSAALLVAVNTSI